MAFIRDCSMSLGNLSEMLDFLPFSTAVLSWSCVDALCRASLLSTLSLLVP